MITYITLYECAPNKIAQTGAITQILLSALRSTQGPTDYCIEGDAVSIHNAADVLDDKRYTGDQNATLTSLRAEIEVIARAFNATTAYAEVVMPRTLDVLYFQWSESAANATQLRAFQALPKIIRWRIKND